ncbi:50S ribosomal protein L24 [Flavobacterium wongokense]|jgi:large subunit ribosomal protein L24|uniref:50S ribosomal protein L24 n=1 Tax=Flavobacterium wongokense TaxID=2910674 RepID=UPI001F38B660|nr:50S ribosomal protein L24 [Flavobacterium sp. WG47]MCF6133059.1 50S ribosomal protein L24 [Flavobacterium sp. WG47]NBU80398.1 50S ribosomal protein L24 [Flavobacteriaceae bacterium]
MIKLKVKTGDTVKVIAGDHKGTTGKITRVYREKNKAIVEGVNMVSKHTKPSAKNPQGGIVKMEAPIHISNLSLVSGADTAKGGAKKDSKKANKA